MGPFIPDGAEPNRFFLYKTEPEPNLPLLKIPNPNLKFKKTAEPVPYLKKFKKWAETQRKKEFFFGVSENHDTFFTSNLFLESKSHAREYFLPISD